MPSESVNFKTALQSPQWNQAMQNEYRALIENRTWTFTPLPLEQTLLAANGSLRTSIMQMTRFSVTRHGLWLKGIVKRLDYLETFSPVIKHTTIRVVLAHAVSAQWNIHQIDVNNAFLNGDLHENVYMQKPPGIISPNPQLVCKLNKAIYGLKQAPHSWYKKLISLFNILILIQSLVISSLFVRFTHSSFLFVLIYVDDIIIIGSVPTDIILLLSTPNYAFPHLCVFSFFFLSHFLTILIFSEKSLASLSFFFK